MVKIKLSQQTEIYDDAHDEVTLDGIHLPFHPSFFSVYDRLLKWQQRFPLFKDDLLFKDLTLFYSLATKKYLDHRNPSHLCRVILSIHFMQKSLQRAFASCPYIRHVDIKWIPTELSFPFSSKEVLGCLVGFTLTNRYELLDEENILLVMQKNHPEVKIVKEGSYSHHSVNTNLKVLYFEIEKRNEGIFSLSERQELNTNLEKQIRGCVQKLSPTVFMRRNEEEIYKMILTLSREIHSAEDIPQAWINFEHQEKDEVVFVVVLVYAAPQHHFPLEKFFAISNDCTFVSERLTTVRQLKDHPIEAHVFRLHLPRAVSFVRSDGSLDFYASRHKVVELINSAIGEFRDYNGGSLIKQRELLDDFKAYFPSIAQNDSELMETFFYAITPLEKQALLNCKALTALFQHFLDIRHKKLPEGSLFSLEARHSDDESYVAVHGGNAAWKETILRILDDPLYRMRDFTYTIVDFPEGVFFHGIIMQSEEGEQMLRNLEEKLRQHEQRLKQRQILRVGGEYSLVSLDPRVGGDVYSSNVLRLLFEGLTRFDKNGNIENGIAETIEISPDRKHYTFKLRQASWNSGAAVTAYDFEYAWKKVLSPDFKTTYSYLFYPIKLAKEAKEGRVHVDKIGISVPDEKTLKVELIQPTPYFLELTAQSIYSPVRQKIDLKHPQWPYQVGTYYPCNGPFQLMLNDPSHQTYQLVKNPCYWDTTSVSLDEVLLTKINPHQALQAFQKGELDWIGNPFGWWHPFFAQERKSQHLSISQASAFWLVFNTLRAPYNNCHMRQAFAFAFDRSQLIHQCPYSWTEAYSPLLPRQCPSVLFPKQNIQKAQELLEIGLGEMGLTRQQLPPLHLIFSRQGNREEIAYQMANQIKNFLGIDVRLDPLNWKTLLSKISKGDFDAGLILWVSLTNDAITTLNAFRHSNEDINLSTWEDATFQRWLNLCDQEVDQIHRTTYLTQAEERLCDQMPIIPLFYQPYQALVRKDMQAVYHRSFDLAKSSFK